MERKPTSKEPDGIQIKIPHDTIAAIMNFGITELAEFVCIDKAQVPQGVSFGEWAAQRLLSGQTVRFYDSDTPPGTENAMRCDMTMEMLLDGVKRYLDAGLMFLLEDDGTLEADAIEPDDSIPILSMAMLGAWSNGKEGRR